MSYSERLSPLIAELDQLDARRAEILSEINRVTGGQTAPPETGTGPGEASATKKATPKKEGKPLKAIVLSVIGSRKAKIDTIVQRVANKTGQDARPAAVGSCVAQLVREGKVTGTGEAGYQLVRSVEGEGAETAPPEEAPAAAAPASPFDQPAKQSEPEGTVSSIDELVGAAGT